MSQPLLPVTVGFAVTLLLGLGAGPFVRWAAGSISKELPDRVGEAHRRQWRDLTVGNEGGKFIGWIERIIFFVALQADGALLIAAWLAFKVASKWNAWTNITAVPKEVKDIAELDLAIGRRGWASHVLTTFLAGTGYNICAAMLGAAVTHRFAELSKLIGY